MTRIPNKNFAPRSTFNPRRLLEDLHHVDLLIRGEEQPGLFTADSAPGSEVRFGSESGDIEVYFPGGSPLVGLPNPFRVAAGPPITASLDPKKVGNFEFVIAPETAGGPRLYLHVAEGGTVTTVGFQVDRKGVVVLQIFAFQAAPGATEIDIFNRTNQETVLNLAVSGVTTPSHVPIPAHGQQQFHVPPESYGRICSIALEQSVGIRGHDGFQSGGTVQADILVEPPPSWLIRRLGQRST